MSDIKDSGDGSLTLKGRWYISLYGPDGQLKEEREGPNVIATNGKEMLVQFLTSAISSATNTFRYIAIGTDSTAEAAANTALGTESSRHTGTVSYVSNQIYQVKATFATGSGTGNIREYGLFNSSSGGTMLSRDVEAGVDKGANDTLTCTLQITVS